MTLQERQRQAVEELEALKELEKNGDWYNLFAYLIDLGRELPQMPENIKVESNRIQSCMSKTYFCVEAKDSIVIHGWSNAEIPAGLIALVKKIFDGLSPAELKEPITFHTESGLMDNLTVNRQQGLLQMIEKIKSSRL